jgi:F0F1-type ATP synthase epsilon subunit
MVRRQNASTGQIVDDGRAVAPSAPRVGANGEPIMHVKVYSPFRTYFDEDALSISAVNETGPFDVLPRHHNFMTLLNPCELDIRSPRGQFKIKISRGIMHVKADQVIVFLDV